MPLLSQQFCLGGKEWNWCDFDVCTCTWCSRNSSSNSRGRTENRESVSITGTIGSSSTLTETETQIHMMHQTPPALILVFVGIDKKETKIGMWVSQANERATADENLGRNEEEDLISHAAIDRQQQRETIIGSNLWSDQQQQEKIIFCCLVILHFLGFCIFFSWISRCSGDCARWPFSFHDTDSAMSVTEKIVTTLLLHLVEKRGIFAPFLETRTSKTCLCTLFPDHAIPRFLWRKSGLWLCVTACSCKRWNASSILLSSSLISVLSSLLTFRLSENLSRQQRRSGWGYFPEENLLPFLLIDPASTSSSDDGEDCTAN
jgi:hypothetical protein